MDSSAEQRNKCSSNSGGFSFLGFGSTEESTKCSSFDAASNTVGKKSLKRMEHYSYGVLPSKGVGISF